MKKIILICAAAIVSIAASAQNKGEKFVGGEFGFSAGSTTVKTGNTSYGTDRLGTFNIGVSGGYFLSDHLAVQAALGYGLNTFEVTGMKFSNTFNIGVGASYYVNLIDEKFFWTPGVGVNFRFGNAGYEAEPNASLFGFSLNLVLAAVEYKFNENYSVFGNCGGLQYNLNTTSRKINDVKYKNINNDVLLNLSFMPTIGFRYWF